MNERIEVATQNLGITDGKYKDALLKYYIISSEVFAEHLDFHVLSFGSEIEMYFEENNCKNCVSAIVKDITTNKDEICKFIQKLKNNYVTPVALNDIVQDYLSAV